MPKRLLTVVPLVLVLSLVAFAAAKSKKSTASGPVPDKAYLEKLLAGWSSGDPAIMSQYYAQGDYAFFDIAPLKYNNWAEYQKGVTDLLKGYKSLKLTLNDDAKIYPQGDLVWATATVKDDAVTNTGKHEMATLRWSLIFQKQDGKWLIVHEHMSEPRH